VAVSVSVSSIHTSTASGGTTRPTSACMRKSASCDEWDTKRATMNIDKNHHHHHHHHRMQQNSYHNTRHFTSSNIVRNPNSNPNPSTSTDIKTKTPPTAVDDGKSPFQITTPIYYVNDKPHIGHAYTSLACDVIARYMRLSGREVFFLSGTDEHGQKVEESAKKRNMSPQEFVDEVSQTFRNLLHVLNISNDAFIRTTDDHHKKAIQHLWGEMTNNNSIYLGSYEGWYSVRDECYYNETEVDVEDGTCIATGSEVIWQAKEPSYFFKLSDFEERLLEYYQDNPDFIAPEKRRNEVIGFVKKGLRDLSISRTSFEWGVAVPVPPTPGDLETQTEEHHIMYVWIDALANYISAIGYPQDEENFQKYWPASLHIVGKDILRFHAVYWPAFLMAAGLPIPRRLFAHGWWTKDGEKISKSLGNVIDPLELVEKYGVDQTRFFLMSEVNFGNDGDFSHDKMVLKINTHLANELGNLCQRTLAMVYKNCNKAVPNVPIESLTKDDEALLAKARGLRQTSGEAISSQQIHKYVATMIGIVNDANKYIDDMEPWVLRKTNPDRMAVVLYVLMEVLRHCAILYQPLMPSSANKILDLLTVPEEERTFDHLSDIYAIRADSPIEKPKGIFPRIEIDIKA